jgi:light-regulated signal transduction histidine kinase (bacteriophytochrome)
MFQRLSDRKYPGSGIGLTISQKVAEAQEGYIEAGCGPGKGTIINCYLSTSLQQKETKLPDV